MGTFPHHTLWHQLTNRLADPATFMDGTSVSTLLRGAHQSGNRFLLGQYRQHEQRKQWHHLLCTKTVTCMWEEGTVCPDAAKRQKQINSSTAAKGLARGWCFKWQGSGETLHPCRSLAAIADIQTYAGSLERAVGAGVSSATACHKAHQPITVPKEDQCAPSGHSNRSISGVTLGRLLQGGFFPSTWCPCRNEACDFCSRSVFLMKKLSGF